MFELPSVSDLNGIHSFIVHFPIALFLSVPFIILIGIVKKQNYIYFYYTALMLLVVACLMIFAASVSGETEALKFSMSKKAAELLDRHKEYASICKGIFVGITLIYSLYLIIPALLKKQLSKKIHTAINIVLLMLYIPSGIMILQLAFTGSRLISEYKIFDMLK